MAQAGSDGDAAPGAPQSHARPAAPTGETAATSVRIVVGSRHSLRAPRRPIAAGLPVGPGGAQRGPPGGVVQRAGGATGTNASLRRMNQGVNGPSYTAICAGPCGVRPAAASACSKASASRLKFASVVRPE